MIGLRALPQLGMEDKGYIMEHGRFVESGSADDCILHPTNAYAKRLISDVSKICEKWDLDDVDKNAN